MLNSFRPRSNCELEDKFIQDRIVHVEKNLAELCHVFGQYNHKAAGLRDKGDEVAKVALNFAQTENINRSLIVCLENFAESITSISDYGDVRAQMIDSKVVNEFSRYEDVCKHVKEEVKNIYSARDKKVVLNRQLHRIRERNPRNRQLIVQVETELVKATAEVSKSIHNLEEKTISFERQKLHDIKSILLDFISIEMGYNSKVLQVLTRAYNEVDSIDEKTDLEEFKKSLRMPDTIPHDAAPRNSLIRSSAHSFGSLGAIFSSTYNKKTPGIPKSSGTILSKSQETLDSLKQSISDTDEASLSDSESPSNEKSSDDGKDLSPSPPILVRKLQK